MKKAHGFRPWAFSFDYLSECQDKNQNHYGGYDVANGSDDDDHSDDGIASPDNDGNHVASDDGGNGLANVVDNGDGDGGDRTYDVCNGGGDDVVAVRRLRKQVSSNQKQLHRPMQ